MVHRPAAPYMVAGVLPFAAGVPVPDGEPVGRSRRAGAALLRAPLTARTWRAVGYSLVSVVCAGPALVLPLVGIVAGALSMVVVGLPVLVGVLVAARGAIRYFRWPARLLLGWDWPAAAPVRGATVAARARAVLQDGRAWRALAYCLVKFPLAATMAYLNVLAIPGGLFCLTCPAWSLIDPTGWGLLNVPGWGASWTVAGTGAAALLLFPWPLRLLVALDRRLVVALLAPGPAERRIARLETARTALRADAATTLRRLERDLHDGTQARLVSLGVTLSRIRQRVGRLPDAEGAAELGDLVETAIGSVTDGLAELRDIIRGIHPPGLDDGLATALSTLAARSGLPVEVSIDLREPPADPIATTVYFTAAELLANTARHAGATRVRLSLSEHEEVLRLAVDDDGAGGAAPTSAGTGLAGLRRRAAALDGSLDIRSPAGGPTTVTLTLPRG